MHVSFTWDRYSVDIINILKGKWFNYLCNHGDRRCSRQPWVTRFRGYLWSPYIGSGQFSTWQTWGTTSSKMCSPLHALWGGWDDDCWELHAPCSEVVLVWMIIPATSTSWYTTCLYNQCEKDTTSGSRDVLTIVSDYFLCLYLYHSFRGLTSIFAAYMRCWNIQHLFLLVSHFTHNMTFHLYPPHFFCLSQHLTSWAPARRMTRSAGDWAATLRGGWLDGWPPQEIWRSIAENHLSTPQNLEWIIPRGSVCMLYIWLVVWNINFILPWLLGIIIPIDFHIFQRGSNHQPDMVTLTINIPQLC